MSPRAKELKPVEIKAAGGGNVTVELAGDDVKVTWVCGATRRFTQAELRAALDDFELAGEFGAWYDARDSRESRYVAALTPDGRFIADDKIPRNGDHETVPWPSFRNALRRAAEFKTS